MRTPFRPNALQVYLGKLHGRAVRHVRVTRGVRAAVLESDVLRSQITPHPRCDAAERDLFYACLAHLGAFLVENATPVVVDATANRRAYRDAARARIARFAQVYVDTPLAVCAARDPKGLYRSKDVTTLPGMQVPYEPPPTPDLVVPGDRGSPQASAAVVGLLEPRLAASRLSKPGRHLCLSGASPAHRPWTRTESVAASMRWGLTYLKRRAFPSSLTSDGSRHPMIPAAPRARRRLPA